MTNNIASNVYITRHTLGSLCSDNTYDDVIALITKLEYIVKEYKYSKNIHVQCANDILDCKFFGESLSLEDILLEVAKDDWSILTYFYSEFEKAIADIKTNIPSYVYYQIFSKPTTNTFPRDYPLTIDNTLWPQINIATHTCDWKDTLGKNSKFIAQYNKDKDDFIKLSVLNYDNLIFHQDIASTLDSIPKRTYKNFENIISDALNSLNQCYHFISKEPNKNEEDVDFISSYTATIGRKLSCSRQGRNKPVFDFTIKGTNDTEKINCEYHLKINWDDTGKRLASSEVIRIYFSLKFDNLLGQKKINVAHIGEHY
ncbi:hypothetical protein PEC301937_01800 [Pectobacterium carotovorum subsp. carotovorum]|nr:hypothetical protein PEC301937_01800 [Pectobacterium carotovorum subsp. carotovorum]